MYKLGIDLGGTNIAAGVVNERFEIVGRGRVKTNLPRSAQEIADDMVKAAMLAVKDANITLDDIDTCGVGSPGSVNPETGMIAFSNNLQFYNVELAKMLNDRMGKKFFLENDANAAAFGEYIAGAGKGKGNFVAITLGTGVGGGIIIDGKIYSGSNYAGGELGHTVINFDGEQCSCGRKGCFEAYASATALIRQTRLAMNEHKESIMWRLCGGKVDKANGITAFDAMRKGDSVGRAVVEQYIKYIAIGLTNVVNTFQPEIICIGGGISKEGDTLIKPLEALVATEDYAKNMEKRVKIVAAKLGNDAGIIGAAYLSMLH